MILFLLTLLTAIALSGVAAYFSIVGLISIFAAAPIPIAVMGTSLEVAKLVAASWIYRNWSVAPRVIKYYFSVSVVILSIITSMGIFGYLSKAHIDQNLVSGDVQSKIAVYDEKIKTEKENIEANRKALKQMDEGVDQVLGRTTDEKGADKAVAMRRSQQKERARLHIEISQSQKSIAELNDTRAPIAAKVRKVEAEVGPIKYIAALLYGDNPDTNLLEKAVRWVTMIIVMVFDPMAILLLIAANFSFKQLRGEIITAVDTPQTSPTSFFTPESYEEKIIPVIDEFPMDLSSKKEGWAPEMYRRVRHEIPKEIMEKFFNK